MPIYQSIYFQKGLHICNQIDYFVKSHTGFFFTNKCQKIPEVIDQVKLNIFMFGLIFQNNTFALLVQNFEIESGFAAKLFGEKTMLIKLPQNKLGGNSLKERIGLQPNNDGGDAENKTAANYFGGQL